MTTLNRLLSCLLLLLSACDETSVDGGDTSPGGDTSTTCDDFPASDTDVPLASIPSVSRAS